MKAGPGSSLYWIHSCQLYYLLRKNCVLAQDGVVVMVDSLVAADNIVAVAEAAQESTAKAQVRESRVIAHSCRRSIGGD